MSDITQSPVTDSADQAPEQSGERQYTAADYKHTADSLAARIKLLDDKRKFLLTEIEFPHITQKRLSLINARIDELQTELASLVDERDKLVSLANPVECQKQLESIYVELDAMREDEKLYRDEYERLSKIETPQKIVAGLVDKLGADGMQALLLQVLQQIKSNQAGVQP